MIDPREFWHSLLRPDVEQTPEYLAGLTERMRAARLTFGDRVLCPFLRPFFVDAADAARIQPVVETIAALGERVVAAAGQDPTLLDQVALTEAERRLVAIDPGYDRASTASRLDAFLLPDSLQFAEYNGESPAGAGYSQTLAELFDDLPIAARFRERFDVYAYPLMERLLDALLESYRDWGGTEAAPTIAIVDWREVPTWSEFEIIRDRFVRLGVPTFVCDPRDLEFDGRRLTALGRRIDLVYRRVLINDIIARRDECEALVRAYAAGAACVANTFRCKIPHKKAFFAVLTDETNEGLFDAEERALIARHVPWTRLLQERRTRKDAEVLDLVDYVRRHRDRFVIKPNDEYGGTGVLLGWEADEPAWERALAHAVGHPEEAWIAQERIDVRRETFPVYRVGGGVTFDDMLVDMAPYLFRGRFSGFLTRLSATGLANVTSGGGQVPVFRVSRR
jgi:hypothetical protein